MRTRSQAQKPAKIAHAHAAVLTTVLIGSALAACGSSSPAAVTVAGKPISKAEVEHWTRAEAVLSHETIPKASPPAGVIPVPPQYSACIAYLRQHPAVGSAAAGSSTTTLKRSCKQQHDELQRAELAFLIKDKWLNGEAKDRGIVVSEAEVQDEIASFRSHEFPERNEFSNYMRFAGLTEADIHRVERDARLESRLSQAVFENPRLSAAQRRQALLAYTRKWTAKTSCTVGYVVPGCRQYKGSEALR